MTLRQRERDLRDAIAELREEDIPELRKQKQNIENEAQARVSSPEHEAESVHDLPNLQRRHEQLTEQIQNAYETADGLEHYADEWVGEGEPCVFVLEELNGDEYAKTVDTVTAAAAGPDATAQDVPRGLSMVESLKYGVEDVPGECPTDPGKWPAVVFNELFESLDSLTTPSEMDLGNDSLADALDS